MKLVKTDRRSRMNNPPLNDLMNIQLESPSVSSFDPDHAIQEWLKGSKRSCRPRFMNGKPKTKTSRLKRSVPEDRLDNMDEEDIAPIFEDEGASNPSTSGMDMDKMMCAMTVNLRWRMSSQRRMLFRDLI